MKDSLPIGVLMPTLNSMRYLPGHLEGVRAWQDLAGEFVVVDSESTDGTVDCLRANLPDSALRVFSRPRGLYQSWNFGIQQITAKYTYISTVGDRITREGLRHLVAVAEQFQAEVVISPPQFVTVDGSPPPPWRWPIHHLLEWQGIDRPVAVPSAKAFLITALMQPCGILGSSASNLYRTELLQRCPFPTEYGHSGDTAWGLLHSLKTKYAVTPSVVSQFLVHPNAGGLSEEALSKLMKTYADLALEACRTAGRKDLLGVLLACRNGSDALRAIQLQYDERRKRRWPWYLTPGGWQLRARRNAQRRLVEQARKTLYGEFGVNVRPP